VEVAQLASWSPAPAIGHSQPDSRQLVAVRSGSAAPLPQAAGAQRRQPWMLLAHPYGGPSLMLMLLPMWQQFQTACKQRLAPQCSATVQQPPAHHPCHALASGGACVTCCSCCRVAWLWQDMSKVVVVVEVGCSFEQVYVVCYRCGVGRPCPGPSAHQGLLPYLCQQVSQSSSPCFVVYGDPRRTQNAGSR
jgi:hypothetical protein